MGFTTTTCRWPATAIEEHHIDAIFGRNAGEFFFGFINAPVGHQITTIFGAIRKTKHDGLAVVPFLQVLTIDLIFVQLLHNIGCFLQIVDGLEQGNDVDSKVFVLPAASV